jgi:preprotein translocase subunit SecG
MVRTDAPTHPRTEPLACTAMTPLLVIIDVLSALTLIGLVLLHSGRGGGLSDMFGGGLGAQAAGSTVIEKNLDRITVVVALVFTFVTLALALLMDE